MQVMKYFGTTGITIEYWKYFTWWTRIPARAAGTARFGPSARPPPSAAGPPPATALPPPLGHLPPPPPCHRRQAPLPTPPSAAGPLSASGLPPPRTASGQLSAPPSPPMEGTGNGAVRLRIYRRSVEEGALTIVTEMTSLAPPQPSGAASYVDKIDTQPDGDTGLYVAFVRGEVVLDVARLCFHGGQQISEDDQEEPTKFLSSSDDNWGCMTSGEEEEVEGQQMGDEDQDEPAYFLTSEYGNWASRTSWEEEVEGGEDEGADDDYDDDEEEEEEEEDEENEEEEEEDLQEKKGGEDEGADDDFDDEEEEEEDEEDEEDLQEKNVPPHWRRLLLLHRTPPYCHRGEGEDAVATVVGKEGEDAIATVVGEEEEEQEEDEDSSSGDKDPEDRKEYPGKDPNMIHIQIKTWLPQKRFLVKISRGGCWVLTKEYCMIWLKIEEVEQLLNEKCFAIGSTVSRRSNCLVEFESMVASPAPLLSEMIKGVIEPSTEDFRMLGLIGRGGSARVFKCLFSGSVCALKATPQDKSMFTEPREIGIISILKDKHVMTFYQAWVEPWSYKQEPERNYVFMHMEFCPRTLEDALLPYQIENKWLGFQEILRGIKYLHGELVVHRDLKPANIFLSTNGVIRIGDFGDACFGHDEFGKYGGTPGCGTANYIAPELDGGEKVTNKVDIYSVGVIFFEIFAMFHTGSERSKVFGTLRDEGPPQGWKGNSELYNKMTAFEPSDRPSAIDVLEYIEEELSG